MEIENNINDIIKDIPGYNNFAKIEPVRKGVSANKYCVETSDGRKLLLNIDDVSEFERRKIIFDNMNLAAAQGVPMCLPVDLGVCNDGKNLYQLMTWCEGKDLDKELPKLSEVNQYVLGIKSGEILRRLHSVPAPDGLEDWYIKYHDVYVERMYLSLNRDVVNVKIENQMEILGYFQRNKHLLKHRPQTLRHGDYHTGNLMVTDNLDLYVIDWNLMEYGNNYADPWEEFNRICHEEVIPHYTTGLIRGYFGGEPPAEFWDLLVLYLSATSLMLVSWAFYFEENKDHREGCVQLVKNVLCWFNDMTNPVPTWYLKEFHG
jgi:serine/threonine-protein kinase